MIFLPVVSILLVMPGLIQQPIFEEDGCAGQARA
jgi:hypothetical protein